jgi:hypothetical protein
MEAVKSLNDLSIKIHEIGKKYDIKSFVTEFKTSVREINQKAWDEIDTITASEVSEATPLSKIMLMSSILNDEDLSRVMKVSESLNKKYHYETFSKECEVVRRKFLEERNNYFSVKAIQTTKGQDTGGLNSYVEITGMSDMMLGSWIYKILERIYPYTLDIEYETLNGSRVKTQIVHKNNIVSDNYIECPLIPRYHGSNGYDQFLLNSYYDNNKMKWIYIPVRLIVNLSSPDGINLDDLDLPDEHE